jgi:hypothetical protein
MIMLYHWFLFLKVKFNFALKFPAGNNEVNSKMKRESRGKS